MKYKSGPVADNVNPV